MANKGCVCITQMTCLSVELKQYVMQESMDMKEKKE